MSNLIESLIGNAVKRQDEVRLKVTLRPAPVRPRHLLELFMAMGSTCSFQALRRSIDLKDTDPAIMVFATLGRWPTAQETATFEKPYEPWPHMQRMLRSAEFRMHFPRRVMDAFPERRRLLFVSIPSSDDARVMTTLTSKHPVLRTDLAERRFDNPGTLAQTIGTMLAHMNSSNALGLAQSRLKYFCDDPATVDPANDPLAWHVPVPPCRPDDLVFAMLRDPVERALHATNAACADVRRGARPLAPDIQEAIGLPTASDQTTLPPETWRDIAAAMLMTTLRSNPVCHALGDGTAEGALLACTRVPVQLVRPDQFGIWGRTALDTIPPGSPPPPDPVLRVEELSPAQRDRIADVTAQDRIFYDRFVKRQAATGLPAVTGRDL